MRQIPLTKGKVALVDDDDYKRIRKRKWVFGSHGYALTNAVDRITLKKRAIALHRLVLNLPASFVGEIDHRNRNKLDCRKSNLRTCSRKENARNIGLRSDNSSGFKGVYWYSDGNKWRSTIKVDGEVKSLGVYTCLMKAARAYDEAAAKYFGEFACLNFPKTT